MKNYENITEEGLEFINLMQLPIDITEYILHKNAIDVFIRNFKEKYHNEVNIWGWEMKNTFPTAFMLSASSNMLVETFLLELLKITTDKNDNVIQVFNKNTFKFRMDRLKSNIDNFLFETMPDFKQILLLQKLSSSSLNEKSKLFIGILIDPNYFLSAFIKSFPNMTFHSITENNLDFLIDYAERIENDKASELKLFTIGNSVLAGIEFAEISKIEKIIEESLDENGNYDEILAMKKINKHFEKIKMSHVKEKINRCY